MGRLIATVMVLCLVLAVAPAGADTVRLATIDAAPWASVEAGRPVGALPDIAAELERRTPHRFHVEVLPLARLERELEAGEHDCTIILWNDVRARVLVRGEEVYPMPFGVIARRGVRLAAYEDLAPLTTSVVRGLRIDPRFDADPALRKEADKDYLQGLRKIARARLDAIAGALPTIRYLAEREGVAEQLGDTLKLSSIPLTLQWARSSPRIGLLPEVNAALAAMRADGTLPRLLARHHYR